MSNNLSNKMFNLNIDFMRLRFVSYALAIVMTVLSIGAFALNGLRLGLDFTGGTLVELHFDQAPSLDQARAELEAAGYDQFIVQNFGSSKDVLVRLNQGFSPEVGKEVQQILETQLPGDVELTRAEFVGAQVGDELKEQGALGILVALLGILVYVGFRFQFKFALSSVITLFYNVLVMFGFISLFKLDFDLTVLAAVLAVIGYAINDTIVVFDRIRENFRIIRGGTVIELINTSINQTLARTTITSLTTLLVVLSLLFLGGEMIHNFALILAVGIVVGTFGSIFVASPLLILLKLDREDLALPVKEDPEEIDGRP